MNNVQKELIIKMNKVCTKKCPLTVGIDKALEYVVYNITEYKEKTGDWEEDTDG